MPGLCGTRVELRVAYMLDVRITFPAAVITNADKYNSGEKGSLWLTVPAGSPSW